MFDKQSILKIKEKIASKTAQPTTEEATKQWLIMSLLTINCKDNRQEISCRETRKGTGRTDGI